MHQLKVIRYQITDNRVEFRTMTEFRRYELPCLALGCQSDSIDFPINISGAKDACL